MYFMPACSKNDIRFFNPSSSGRGMTRGEWYVTLQTAWHDTDQENGFHGTEQHSAAREEKDSMSLIRAHPW